MQGRRRADIDDIDRLVGDEGAIIAMGRGDAMALGEIDDMIAARANGGYLDIHPIDPPISLHMQLGDEAAADQADFHA